MLIALPGTDLAHDNQGISNASVVPGEIFTSSSDQTVTVNFDYTIWHDHWGTPQQVGWWIYLNGTEVANGQDTHPADGSTVTNTCRSRSRSRLTSSPALQI